MQVSVLGSFFSSRANPYRAAPRTPPVAPLRGTACCSWWWTGEGWSWTWSRRSPAGERRRSSIFPWDGKLVVSGSKKYTGLKPVSKSSTYGEENQRNIIAARLVFSHRMQLVTWRERETGENLCTIRFERGKGFLGTTESILIARKLFPAPSRKLRAYSFTGSGKKSDFEK